MGGLCHLARGAGSASKAMLPRTEAYHRTKWHLDPSSRLATTNGPKLGGCAPLLGRGGAATHLAQCGMGRGLPPYQVAS